MLFSDTIIATEEARTETHLRTLNRVFQALGLLLLIKGLKESPDDILSQPELITHCNRCERKNRFFITKPFAGLIKCRLETLK